MSTEYRCDWCGKNGILHPKVENGFRHYCSFLCSSKDQYLAYILYEEKDRSIKDSYFAGADYASKDEDR